jgi:hypothetical protein
MIKVKQMASSRSGRPVANQFIIEAGAHGTYFQSYNTVIANVKQGVITFDKDWQYSRTTSKYLHQFLLSFGINLTTKEKQQKVANGEIQVISLNEINV